MNLDIMCTCFVFFKQKTAYEMRISDWSSDVCSSDLLVAAATGEDDRVAAIILFDLRLPRTLLALAVGAMLGLAGAALQGYLRNPLAEPSVLGTSNAAALGGVAALSFGILELHPVMLPLLATGGALLSLALLFILSGPADSPPTLILAGIAVGTLAVAGKIGRASCRERVCKYV